jgi:hypothetical protein
MNIGRRESADDPAARTGKQKFTSGFASLRDLISFVAGMIIIGYEVFFADHIEVYAIGVGVALAGLPVVFGADERKKK